MQAAQQARVTAAVQHMPGKAWAAAAHQISLTLMEMILPLLSFLPCASVLHSTRATTANMVSTGTAGLSTVPAQLIGHLQAAKRARRVFTVLFAISRQACMSLHLVGHWSPVTTAVSAKLSCPLTRLLPKASCAPKAHVNRTLCVISNFLPACAALDSDLQQKASSDAVARVLNTAAIEPSKRTAKLHSMLNNRIQTASRAQRPASNP